MKKLTADEIKKDIELHKKWLTNEDGGARLDWSGCNLDNASLDNASLDNASLRGASLDNASLRGASLQGASLQYASLRGASLDNASLDNASLDNASLDNSKGLLNYCQVSFKDHGECGRMLTALILKDGEAPIYQCGCFKGNEKELITYIENGEEKYKKSRFRALAMVKMGLDL